MKTLMKRKNVGAGNKIVRSLIIVLLLTATATRPGTARSEEIKNLDAPVTQGSKITYKMLVNSVFKGVRKDVKTGDLATAEDKTLRRIGDKERTEVPAGTSLNTFKAIRVRGDGRTYIVMFWNADQSDNGWGTSVLAVFPDGSSEPQDVADVRGDRECYLQEPPLSVGADDAFAILNTHLNAGEEYLFTKMLHIHGGRFRNIANVFTLSGAGNGAYCYEAFTEELKWSTEPDAGSPYSKIIAKVTLNTGPNKDDDYSECPKKIRDRTRVFTETFRWDKTKGRFISVDNGLKELARFNKKKIEG